MLTTTTTTAQIAVDVKLNGSPPIGTSTLRATATPPTMPPSCNTFESARTIQSMFTHPRGPSFGGTLL